VGSTITAHQPYGAGRRTGRIADAAIAAVLFAGSLTQLSHRAVTGFATGSSELDAVGVVLVGCSTLPLIGWRRAPRAVFAITALAAVLLGGLGYALWLALGPTAAVFFLAASRDDEDPWRRADTGLMIGLFLAYAGATALANGEFPGSELLHTGLAWATAWFAGERTRLRHEHIAELAERAARSEREAERERLLAVAEERARIARDLHDSAGHAINVIAVRAGAARMRRDPDRSQEALTAIEELARKTAGEVDEIVGTLRDRGRTNGSVDAPPSLASLDTLIAAHAVNGLDARVACSGRPRELEGAVDQAAYRILQEALTNAARHGAGPARIELAYGDSALDLIVSNPAASHGTSRPSGGHGLIGMRERATLLGGELDVERANGTFRVRAHLPYRGRSA
jgi:signal transduction histidine kinase